MKRAWILWGLMACASPVFAQEENTKAVEIAALHHTSPEEALSLFVSLFNGLRFAPEGREMIPVVGADANDQNLRAVLRQLDALRGEFSMSMHNLQVKTEGEKATVKLSIKLSSQLGLEFNESETLQLQRRKNVHGTEWAIIPRTEAEVEEQKTMAGPLQALADNLAYPKITLNRMASRLTLQNIKQLALGIMQFVQDYNEKYGNLSNDNFKQRVSPYVRDETLFHAPGLDDEVGYFFNPNLTNKNLAEIESPAETVMIFESIDGQLNFRHDNCVAVGFADGHVKLITRQEAKTLRWKP